MNLISHVLDASLDHARFAHSGSVGINGTLMINTNDTKETGVRPFLPDCSFWKSGKRQWVRHRTRHHSGSLKPSRTYTTTIQLLNETVVPADDISLEVEEEANDLLICFDGTANISIDYEDADDNSLPLGLATSWVRNYFSPTSGRNENRACPGVGETDVEVTFKVKVE